MTDGPRMLVSLGAQKAATTWLAQYLEDHPQCMRTPMKETHFFDYYDFNIRDHGKQRVERRLEAVIARGKAEPKRRNRPQWKKAKLYFEMRLKAINAGEPTYDAYEELFLAMADDTTKIVGDITPANGLLSIDRLKAIAALPNQPLFVLTLRDPVDRTWSAVRMSAERSKSKRDFDDVARRQMNHFIATDEGPHHLRSDYATMLDKVKEAIPADRVSIDFFEEFLNQPKIDAFCDFLGVDHHPARLGSKKLEGKSAKMVDRQKQRLSAKLRPVYDAVEARIGRLPDRWIQNRDLAA